MVKYGKNPSGTQKYKCEECNRIETPEPQKQGYGAEKRELAVNLILDGNSYRSAARVLGVSHPTVMAWYAEAAKEMPAEQPKPEGEVDVIELDELFTFAGSKKTQSMSSHR